LHLGNDTKVDGLINFEKMRMIAREIRTVRQYCEPTNFINSYSPNKHMPILPTGVKKRHGGKQQDPERIYREASAARKVKQYLDIHWDKIIKDEDRLQAVSKNLEPPPAPNSATLSRKSNGDTLSVHSSPGQTLKHQKHQKNHQHHHQRTGSEPVIMGTPRLATVTVTKGNSRQMIPVSELPKFGAENKSKLNKIMSLAEQPSVSRYGERRRHKSGQSDTSSVCTISTTHTNQSEPIPTNKKPPRKPRSTMGIPHSPSLPLRDESTKTTTSGHRSRKERSRPISEHFGTMSLSPSAAPIDTPRQRQKSVDNASKSERKPKEKSTRASYHRSTPDLLQAPINPIYQPSESSDQQPGGGGTQPIKIKRSRNGAFYISNMELTDL